MAPDCNATVTFNVGGQTFTTVRETLLKEANSRLALIARGVLPSAKDPASGAYVLDRDPKYFQLVLNWLRDGWCLLPRTAEERRELLQEVRFYHLSGFEGWLRTQEVLGDSGVYSAPDLVAFESPRPRIQLPGQQQTQPQHLTSYSTLASPPPSSAPPASASASPHSSLGAMATAGRLPTSAWTAASAAPPPSASGAATPLGGASYPGTTLTGRAPHSPMRSPPPPSPSSYTAAAAATAAGTSYGAAGLNGGGVGLATQNGWMGNTGGGGGGGGGAPSDAMASLREAFSAATAPQRPAAHVAPYSLPSTADESGSWTSKYLRGNEGLRELVNTLLELAFLAPHRSLNGGKSHLSLSVACGHTQEASLVGSKEEHMRSKLLEIRVRGALGWSFHLTLRPSSDVALWDKYGGVAAAVQDNWFVLGAVLKDQFGVVMEEDTAARPSCAACRRTCLAITLNKIF